VRLDGTSIVQNTLNINSNEMGGTARSWMNRGVVIGGGGSDGAYFGMKVISANNAQTVIAWGDDSGDNLHFINTLSGGSLDGDTYMTLFGSQNTIRMYKQLDVQSTIYSAEGNSMLWSEAYYWGDHSTVGYLTGFTETDPTVPAHVKSITTTNISNWNTAYSWGNHAIAGYQPAATAITTSNIGLQSVNYANSAGSATVAGYVNNQSGQLFSYDNRVIAPADTIEGYLQFGFTSWRNDGGSPYADYLHMRSYTDASGGTDNLIMFLKSGIGMRIWQQSWGSNSPYAEYVDVWTTGNFTQTNVNNWNSAYSWGNHSSQGYATQTYVNTAIANLVDAAPDWLNTLNELAAALGDDPNFATTVTNNIAGKVSKSGDTMTGNLNWAQTDRGLTWGMNTDGAYIKFFNAGDGDSDSRLEYATSDNGDEYHRWVIAGTERMNLRTEGLNVNGVIYSSGYGNSTEWYAAYTWGNHAGLYASISHTHTFASITSKPTTIAGYGITNAYTDAQIQNFFNGANAITGYNKSNWDTAYSWGNHASAGYLTSLPSHNHDDRYYTESESDGRYLYYRGINVEADFQRFQDGVGEVRFDRINDYNNLSNAPGGYNYGGVLSMRGDNFGFQIWGSHTGDLYYKTQWSGDNYTGWRNIITSLNIGSQSVNYANSAGSANSVAWTNVSSRPTALSQFTNDLGNYGGWITGYTETDTLATVTARGASTGSAVTLSSGANHFNGHHYFDAYDNNGNHYPHYNPGSSNNGSKLNLRMFDSGGSVILFYLNGATQEISWGGNVIWHAGNDGAGSGLDADKLDGYQPSSTGGGNYIAQYASNGYLYVNNWIHPANGTGLFYDSGPHFYESGGEMYSSHAMRINGRLYLNEAESASLYGIRGRFTNEYIHLYNKVGIGHPNGWGQGETNTPVYGLSTYGGINIGYGYDGGATINTYTRINKNWGGGDFGGEAFTIYGNNASLALRSVNSNSKWLFHMDTPGDLRFYEGGTVSNNAWTNYITFFRTGRIAASGGDSDQWNSAYSWGNHAGAGYWNVNNPDPVVILSNDVRFEANTAIFVNNLEVQGQFFETSSLRYKENVINLETVTEKVNKLRPVRYNKIGNTEQEIGLIAEEVSELFPEFVNYNEAGQPDSLNYTRLSVVLLQTIKELSDKINKLETK
jgi:hypothetical protein